MNRILVHILKFSNSENSDQNRKSLEKIMKKFDYYQPQSLEQAYELIEKFKGRAEYIAGGTDIIVQIKQKAAAPAALVSLRGIKELKGIKSNGGLTLGSMTLIRELEREPVIAYKYPALHQAAQVLANPQIRNVATVGGNLCNSSPCADTAPPLLVMESVAVLEGPESSREIPLDQFFTGPGQNCMNPTEVLTKIRISEIADNVGMCYIKTGRLSQDISIVSAAALILMDGAICKKCRIAVGSVAPIPKRLKNVECIVEGSKIDNDFLEHVRKLVEQEVSPITDVRSTEEYRKSVAGILVKRAIISSMQGADNEKTHSI